MSEQLIRSLSADGAGVLSHRAELAAMYREFLQSIWSQPQPPRRVLQLVRRRIAHIHSLSEEYLEDEDSISMAECQALAAGVFADFDDDEQTALAVAEMIPFGHHQMTDDMVARLEAAFGAAGAVNLLIALSFFDVNCRLQQSLGTADL